MENKKSFTPIRLSENTDKIISIAITVLAVFGFLMVISASMGKAVGDYQYLVKTGAKQAFFILAGYVGMVFMSKQFNFKLLKNNANMLMVLTIGVLLFALAFAPTGGARAWIKIPVPGVEVTIQPSEFSKITIICIIAAYLGDLKNTMQKNSDIYKAPLIFVSGAVLIVIILQKDLGSGVVMAAIAAVCFLIPKHPQLKGLQNLIIFLLSLGVVGAVVLLSPFGEGIVSHLPLQSYQINRILSAVNPFIDRYNTGYQLINGLISFASGGFIGLGYGNSIRKYTNFPAADTDYILAIVVEELGFIGFFIIFALYITIILRLFKYAFKLRSEKGQIILVGTAMYLLIHFVLNVGGVTGLIPLTGVPLLMVSSGGSSTMSLMLAIGISQSLIFQYNKGQIR